jgi:iron complex outermembrane receptor protein
MSRPLLATVSAFALVATSAAAEAPAVADEVIVTGTRAEGRTALSSPAPVDVLSGEALARSGAVADELGQAVGVLAPSFNFPRQSNSGSSDHVRAGQLRGLSPDQVLVLVNGRRRHVSAVVNSETKIGRGTAAVDFNTLPLGAVKRVEVLRDGAGALYGSDAVAGVVNVILDDAPRGWEVRATYGAHVTELEPIGDERITDGETWVLAAEAGAPLGTGGGFVRFGGEFEDRAGTNRAGFDQVPFFIPQTPANLAFQGRRNYVIGDPDVEDRNLWFNAELPLGAEIELYAFGTWGLRETEGAAFFRYPDAFDNVAEVYPEGYLPRTTGESDDLALYGGVRTAVFGWAADLGLSYGRNQFRYGAVNSLNPSFGTASPTRFLSSVYEYRSTNVNLDLRRDFQAFGRSWAVATGYEFRDERFESRPGDPASYEPGPLTLAIGAQGATGLRPQDTAELSREVFASYGSVSTDLTSRLFVEAAARFEDYSDFGNALTGKLAGALRVTDAVSLRGTVSNSVRAPALAQVGFADASTNFGENRTRILTRTLRVDDPVARALGAEDLKEEEAFNVSAGVTVNLPGVVRLTLDAFQVRVDDRITLSDRLFGAAIAGFVQSVPGGEGTESVRFFTNAVDTETTGFDLVAEHAREAFGGDLRLTGAYSWAETEIERFAPTPAELAVLDPNLRLVGVEEINTLEEAAPRWKAVLTADWAGERLSLLARANLYGSAVRVFNFGGGFEPRQRYGSEASFDLEAEWRFDDRVSAAVGAANLFDEYPDLSSPDINYFGNLPYDILSPVGVNGRYLYARVKITG